MFNGFSLGFGSMRSIEARQFAFQCKYEHIFVHTIQYMWRMPALDNKLGAKN